MLRIAVVSDIHADQGTNPDADSYVKTEPPSSAKHSNPLRDLLTYINVQGLTADVVISPGDMTNQAQDAGKIYAWRMLNEIKEALGATDLIASPGNHDFTTHSPSADPGQILKNLSPSYPTTDSERDNQFWTDGYTIVQNDDFRIVTLDSCREFPRFPADGVMTEEYLSALDRGSFPETLQIRLEEALTVLTPRNLNILVTHHHPAEHQRREVFRDTYGPMHRGDELIGVLERAHSSGRWMIIHGHKHVPMLTTAGNSSNSPLILAAASLGGKLWHPIVSVTRNQFHIIEAETTSELGLPDLRGRCLSYMWGFGIGWAPSTNAMSGLPAICGFGVIHDHRDSARQLETLLDEAGHPAMTWQQVIEQYPLVQYFGPDDMELLESSLSEKNIAITTDRTGRPRRLEKLT